MEKVSKFLEVQPKLMGHSKLMYTRNIFLQLWTSAHVIFLPSFNTPFLNTRIRSQFQAVFFEPPLSFLPPCVRHKQMIPYMPCLILGLNFIYIQLSERFVLLSLIFTSVFKVYLMCCFFSLKNWTGRQFVNFLSEISRSKDTKL